MIRGAGNIKPFPTKAIEFDYDTWKELQLDKSPQLENGFYPCSLTIARCSRWEIIKAHWHHPEHAYRLPIQLSLVSLMLGTLGLLLGLISLAT